MSNSNSSHGFQSEDSRDKIPQEDSDTQNQSQQQRELESLKTKKVTLEIVAAILTISTSLINELRESAPPFISSKLWMVHLFFIGIVLIGFLRYLMLLKFPSFIPHNIQQSNSQQHKWRWWDTVLVGFLIVAGIFVLQSHQNKPVLNYVDNAYVGVAAGTGVENAFPMDGLYDECFLQKPGDLSFHNGTLYFVDGGAIRALEDGEVTTLNDVPNNHLGIFDQKALALQAWKRDLFVLCGPWMDEDVAKVSLIRLRNASLENYEEIFQCDYTEDEDGIAMVSDFAVNENGVYYIQIPQTGGVAKPRLEKCAYYPASDEYDTVSETVLRFDDYDSEDMIASRMVFGEKGELFVSVPGQGVILRIPSKGGQAKLFSGTVGKLIQNDKGIPTYKKPVSMAWYDGFLYVMDYSLVRRISVKNGNAVQCETLAGVSPESIASSKRKNYGLHDLAPGKLFRFTPTPETWLATDNDGRVFVSDPKLGFVYFVTTNP